MIFLRLVGNELYKALRQKRVYLFLLFPVVFTLFGIYSTRQWNKNHPDRLNTLFASEYVFTSLDNFLIFTSFFYAIMIVSFFLAEDYADGTLKLTLMRPVSRITILNSKIIAYYLTVLLFFAANFMFTFIIVYFLGDPESVMVFSNSEFKEFQGLSFPFWKGVEFLGICYLLSTFGVFVLGLVLFFFGAASGKSSVAITLSIVLFVACYFYMMLLHGTPYIKYNIWMQFQIGYKTYYIEKLNLEPVIIFGSFKESLQICFAYVAVFYPLTALIFCRKSILR